MATASIFLAKQSAGGDSAGGVALPMQPGVNQAQRTGQYANEPGRHGRHADGSLDARSCQEVGRGGRKRRKWKEEVAGRKRGKGHKEE